MCRAAGAAMVMMMVVVTHAVADESIASWLEQRLCPPETIQEETGAFVRARVLRPELPADAAAWDTAQAALRAEFLDQIVLLGVPNAWTAGPVRVEWSGVLHPAPEYEVRKLRYEALPGLWIPAVLYLPNHLPDKAPAVLNVNGHVGKPGKAVDYEQVRCINLAKRGIIALHPEWYAMGELDRPEYNHNRLAYLDLVGTRGVSVFYLALKRALDVLESLEDTDTERMAMTGLSGGGWQTILLSALDTRIAATAPNAGYIGMGHRTVRTGDIGDLEQVPIDMLTVADYDHLTAMLAPRPALLIFNAKDECCFAAGHAVPAVYDPALPWYQLYGAAESLCVHVNEDPGTHNYDQDNREAFYRFLKQHLAPEAEWTEADLPTEGELYAPEELYTGLPPNNENFVTLAQQLLARQPEAVVPASGSAEALLWAQAERQRLRSVLAMEDSPAGEKNHSLVAPQPVSRTTSKQQRGAVNLTLAMEARVARVAGAWSVPVVTLMEEGGAGKTAVLFVSDDGYAKHAETLGALVEAGTGVIAADLSFLGQMKPEGNAYQFPMLVNATGARALGIQVDQMLALARWARQEYGLERVELHAMGRNASVAALMAAAVAPAVVQVGRDEAPESLRSLVDTQVHYHEAAPLFAFGLLPAFDIPVLRALGASGS